MTYLSKLPSTSTAIRQLIELYTPDGTLGRLLLACATGAMGLFGVWLTAVLLFAGTTLAALTVGPVTGLLSVLLLTVTVLTLWPVYLATIDRVASPTAYSEMLRDSPSSTRVEQVTDAYRSGKLSETELDQQLEKALENDSPGSEEPTVQRQERNYPERVTE